MAEEQVKPLAAASPAAIDLSTGGEEGAAARWRSLQYLRKRRCALWCCGCCGAAVVILAFVFLILALTVLKVKYPILTMNSLQIDRLHAGVGSFNRLLSVNATITADISMENPNVASFRFDDSTTEFYYEGAMVGVAHVPDGRVSAHRTVRLNVTVEVLADQAIGRKNVTGILLLGGKVNMSSHTDITGRVNVLGVYKRDIEVKMKCNMTLDLTRSVAGIKNKVCHANVK